MPINFELTFTQPFLAQLDTGQPKGSKDMAKFITDNYVRTLLTGLPGGGTVPAVLPAPGLSTPAGPPPFPIPSIPINNYSSRKRVMQRILQTYFEAREVLIMQGDIKSTIESIKLLVKKAQTLKKQINTLLAEAAEIQRQIMELPELFLEISNAIVEIIQTEQAKIESLATGLTQFQLQLTPEDFQIKFRKELELINAIKQFKPSLNVQQYDILSKVLTDLEYRLSSIPDAQDGSQEEIFKKYLARQIQSTLLTIVSLSNALVNPAEYINYIRDLANVNVKLAPILDILYRYKFIKKKLQPQIAKLKRKIKNAIQQLEFKIQVRVAEEKEKLKIKLKNLALKKAGPGKKSLYVTAGKTITDFKKKYLKKIKKAKDTIQDVQSIVVAAQRLIVTTTKFKIDIQRLASTDLQEYLNTVQENVLMAINPENNITAVHKELNRIYLQNGITDPIIVKLLNDQLIGKVPSPAALLDYFESSSDSVIRLFQEFLAIIKGITNLDLKVRKLIQKKPTSVPPFIGPLMPPKPTVLDILTAAIQQIEAFLRKIQKKLVDFVNRQTAKLEETIKRITDDVKMQLLMLVPIKSDLKDGKTKMEIIQAKKDKLKQYKDQIKKILKLTQITTTKLIPGFTKITNNLIAGEWRYTTNAGALRDLVGGIYDIKKLNTADSSQQIALDQAKSKTLRDIRDYFFGFELLVDLFTNMASEVSKTSFMTDLSQRLQQNTIGAVSGGYIDFYNKIKSIGSLKNGNIKQVIAFFSDRSAFRVLEKSYIRTILTDLENKHLANTTAYLNQISLNPLVRKLFPGLKPGIDGILVLIVNEINKQGKNILSILQKLYTKSLKPLVDKIDKKLAKIKQDTEAWLKEHVAKRALNLDLKLMSVAFNLATRAFWTGFSWVTPNGVKYTSISIGPFLPMITKPDAGASKLVRELSKNLQLQLNLMVGLVSPPPPTGIPPFPFTGYR